ncbi:HlyD family secretion protein [Sinorhizobium mexicanum]|uniref:HlyD family secretion protein n=1 Tax=Sinorhizobium mexicanum TaxID=375549 RepID=A0A859QBZ6_9HYPH|nr:HlyD family secretion protein [Sinorhizobium mexicanum]MBP1887983.1 membrane fusion protein (multidrug efflux system) [Sinorhizobium mexicanum]QLL60032.1 HlyD family secretion protein [Sinorhizobium mexicanum]
MPEKNPKRKIVRNVVLVLLATAALAYGARYGWHWWTEGRYVETTDNAYVRADVTLLAPRISGYVTAVEVVDNQTVQTGQVLFRVDDRDYRARVDQARADIASRQAAVEGVRNQQQLQRSVIAQAEAEAQSAAAEVERAKADLDRAAQLVRTNAVSVQTFDLARSNATKAAAARAAAEARIVSERGRVSVLASQESAATAALAQSRAALALAQIDLDNTVVRAPIAGTVGNLQVRVGRYVQPGTQMLAIVPISNAYVIANFKETQVGEMRVGQSVELEVDSYPGLAVTGRIDSLSPASGAQFALLPPDNATGNFTKVVQRIPVKILIDRGSVLAGELRPGMSVIARVNTRNGETLARADGVEVSHR